MRSTQNFTSSNACLFKYKALTWAASFPVSCYLDANHYTHHKPAYSALVAAGCNYELKAHTGKAFETLEHFLSYHKAWAFGFMAYDLKNEVEDLTSKQADFLSFPELYFFIPQHLVLIQGNHISILSADPERTYHAICAQSNGMDTKKVFSGNIKSRFSKNEYIKTLKTLQKHIHNGDIYEINFCQEFFAEKAFLDPLEAFKRLNTISPMPFSTFFKLGDKYILSASPERYLKKQGQQLIAQPIKGTAPRAKENLKEDLFYKEQLKNSVKEQAENLMIVDLLRNDLSKCAIPGSVKVEELFGVYAFPQVHHMISTIKGHAAIGKTFKDYIHASFPMGSMTGAPKISAMKLIESFERTKRGVFSGALGYVSPAGDFDFSVIIRAMLYNLSNQYLSFQTGGAITSQSEADKEYNECLLKALAIKQVLS